MRWVIKRYRIYEAIECLNAGKFLAWTHLALDPRYFDQTHFTNDFSSVARHRNMHRMEAEAVRRLK